MQKTSFLLKRKKNQIKQDHNLCLDHDDIIVLKYMYIHNLSKLRLSNRKLSMHIIHTHNHPHHHYHARSLTSVSTTQNWFQQLVVGRDVCAYLLCFPHVLAMSQHYRATALAYTIRIYATPTTVDWQPV